LFTHTACLLQRLAEYEAGNREEQEEVYGEGGPFMPFAGMLQVGKYGHITALRAAM
jgi:hypothetical protein